MTLHAETLIRGNSETAELVRNMDWSVTALGAVESWSEALLSSLNMMLAAPVPMQLFWGPEFICFYNDAILPALAEKHPSMMGRPAREVWSEAWGMVGSQMEHVYSSGEAIAFGNALVPILQNGVLEDRFWAYSYSPVFDGKGEIAGVLDIVQDTTDAVLAARVEEARKAADQRLADYTIATNDALYEVSPDWSVLRQVDGGGFISDTESSDTDWLPKYVHPLDQAAVRAEIERAILTKTMFESEHRVLRADGSVGWSVSRAIPTVDESGELIHWLGAARDVTDRKRDEEEIRNSREQLLLALDAASLASWYYDPARNIVGGDSLMARLFGLTVPEGPAERWLAAVLEEDRERVGREFTASIAGAPYDTEYRVFVDGKIRWIRARAKLVGGSDALTRMLGICEDVTDRKRAEETLHETVERLALAQQAGNIAAWEWNLETGLFTWDAAGAWVYGRAPSEVTRLDAIQGFIHKDDLPYVMESIAPALKGEDEFNNEFRVCWPDGTNHWLIGRGRAVLDENGKAVRLNGVNIDITDRRTAELALRQSEKLAAVGQLASTISHEINNPLESVTNLLYLCKMSTDDPLLNEYLTTAEIELRRVSAITTQTLRFHKQQSRPTEVSCLDLFSNALMIFQGRIENAGIQVEKRKRAERPIQCLEGEIRQVMNNLIGNAIDAMKQGGRLIVRSNEATDWKTGNKGLRLTVADTGAGMSKKTLSQIFQAFYTTKGINGTGLGLWVSQEIVQRHRGRLTVRSSERPGRSGTVFNLFLPFTSDTMAGGSQVL